MPMTARYTVIDGEVVAEKRNGVRRSYVPDPLGSTVALLDNTQTQTDMFTYWPYGEERSRTGTTATPFRFVGSRGYHTDTQQTIYVRARHFHGSRGQWTTPDPIRRFSFDLNAYRYVGNRPTNETDPSGLIPCSACDPLPFPLNLPCLYLCGRLHLPPPPPPPPPAWNYGTCCGLTKTYSHDGPPQPSDGVDCVDKACCSHDWCLRSWWCFLVPGRRRSCDNNLCSAALGCLLGGCSSASNPRNCQLVAGQIAAWFCSPGLGTVPGAPWPF